MTNCKPVKSNTNTIIQYYQILYSDAHTQQFIFTDPSEVLSLKYRVNGLQKLFIHKFVHKSLVRV